MSNRIRPLHDFVIIERLKPEERSKGGIIIPERASEKPIEGRVIAAGTGAILPTGEVRPIAVKAGDQVLFYRGNGIDVEIAGSKVLVLREEDIFAVLEPAPAAPAMPGEHVHAYVLEALPPKCVCGASEPEKSASRG